MLLRLLISVIVAGAYYLTEEINAPMEKTCSCCFSKGNYPTWSFEDKHSGLCEECANAQWKSMVAKK